MTQPRSALGHKSNVRLKQCFEKYSRPDGVSSDNAHCSPNHKCYKLCKVEQFRPGVRFKVDGVGSRVMEYGVSFAVRNVHPFLFCNLEVPQVVSADWMPTSSAPANITPSGRLRTLGVSTTKMKTYSPVFLNERTQENKINIPSLSTRFMSIV